MILIASATTTTAANPEQIFRLWADIDNWPKWDDAIDWAKINGLFTEGATYTLKPKSGPKATATIKHIKKNESFEDVTNLPGAKLIFKHAIVQIDNKSELSHQVMMEGFAAPLWARLIGGSLKKGLQPAVEKLAELAEKSK